MLTFPPGPNLSSSQARSVSLRSRVFQRDYGKAQEEQDASTSENYGTDASVERALGWKSGKQCTFPRSACITQLHNQQLSGAMVKGQGPQSRLCYFYLGGLGFCK